MNKRETVGLDRGSFFPTFPLSFSSETLDEGEDEEDDEGGHADSSERRCSACKANSRHQEENWKWCVNYSHHEV